MSLWPSQPISHWINQSTNQSVTEATSQPISQSLNQPVIQSVSHCVSQWSNQSVTASTIHPISKSLNQPVSRYPHGVKTCKETADALYSGNSQTYSSQPVVKSVSHWVKQSADTCTGWRRVDRLPMPSTVVTARPCIEQSGARQALTL